MAVEIIMPKLGVDMQEGEIIEWKKNEGDQVNEGDILLEIMSDKTNMEIEAEDSGVLLKIVYPAGEVVPVTKAIGYIGEAGEVVDTDNSSDSESQQVAQATAELKAAGLEVPASPLASSPQAQKAQLAADEYDIIVVGGGPAGYYAAIRGAQLGGKIAIVEKSEFGGTCLNKGCIPAKTYLKNAEILDGLKIAAGRGINLASTNYSIDMDKTVDFKNSVVKTLTGGVKGLLKANKVTIFNGLGQVNPDKTVTIGNETIKGNSVILATGSKVSRINIPGIQSQLVLTSDDILDLREIPKTLAVMGGGVVGVELGLVYASYGTEVTVIEMADRIIPAMDKEVSLELQKILTTKHGMTFKTSVGVAEIVEADNRLTLKLSDGTEVITEKALLSIGRVPQLKGLENLNLAMDGNRIKVNDYEETSIPGIYAPGDVNGRKMLAHAAYRMGEVAAENAMHGNTRKANLKYTPAAVYTHPEVAMVGLTEDLAREQYGDVLIGRSSFVGNGRAIASNEAQGFVKVIADRKYHEIIGVHIIGPAAAELINEASTIMENELTVDEVAQSIHGHPTFSENMYEAFLDVLGEAIHNPPKRR